MTDGVERLHGLSAFAEVASSSATVQDLVEQVAQAALRLVGGDSASVCRFERSLAQIRVLHNAGDLAHWEKPWPEDETYRLSEFPQVNTTVGGLNPWWTGSVDNPKTASPDRELMLRLGKKRAASFQIVVGGTIWGDIYLTRTEGRDFDETDIATGLSLTGLLSAGLSRLELLAEMSALAYSDALTGLGNRRAADDWLEERLSAAEPFPPVSVVLCDINGLKRINDLFGHDAGDELIRIVGTRLVEIAGELPRTMIARIGGDEFVLLLDGVDRGSVGQLVERLAEIELPHSTGVAVGAATTTSRPAAATTTPTAARALLRLADAAQYRHKQTRRLSADALSPAAPPVPVLLPSVEPDLTDRILAALESVRDQSEQARLGIVADAVAHAFGAASWWVSRQNGDVLVEALGLMLRQRTDGLVPIDLVSGHEFHLDDYPATRAALGGGGYYASLTEGDEAERALLARMGYVSALAAGDRGADGQGYLVEMFGDHHTTSGLMVALPLLRLFVHVAVHGC